LLHIGSFACEPTGGGSIQLHRHFVESGEFDFHSIVEPGNTAVNYLLSGWPVLDGLIRRASNTRLFPQIYALNCLLGARRHLRLVTRQARHIQPQAIVTVAHGAYSLLAARVARQLGLPLITFFHDWWPDLTPCRGIGKQILDNQFMKLYHQSSLALCVCAEMREELGTHPNAPILWPIPAFRRRPAAVKAPQARSGRAFRLVYLGTLQGKYGELVQSLSALLIENPNPVFELKLYGPASEWSAEARRAAVASGIYLGVPNSEEAVAALSEADAFLLVMNFDEMDRRRVRTSFPSKLLDYCAYGKPLVVWGPDHCSAVRFLNKKNAACLVTDFSPKAMIKATEALFGDSLHMAELGQSALGLSKSMFDPETIQADLRRYVAESLDLQPQAVQTHPLG
jgi:glycosyltransferase involved in cell wall biosynthesis